MFTVYVCDDVHGDSSREIVIKKELNIISDFDLDNFVHYVSVSAVETIQTEGYAVICEGCRMML